MRKLRLRERNYTVTRGPVFHTPACPYPLLDREAVWHQGKGTSLLSLAKNPVFPPFLTSYTHTHAHTLILMPPWKPKHCRRKRFS